MNEMFMVTSDEKQRLGRLLGSIRTAVENAKK
jgi:hypothetical protein